MTRTRLAPVQVDRDAARDRGQPRSELAPLVEALRRSPRLHERLLGRLLGETAVAQHLVRDRVHEPAVGAIDRPHGVGIALSKACAEVPFLHERDAIALEQAVLDGWSWADIAEALGVTRQAVHKKHARRLHRAGVTRGGVDGV